MLLLPYLGEFCFSGILDVFPDPSFIFSGMVAAVHTWEKHILYKLILLVVIDNLILVGICDVLLLDTHIYGACIDGQGFSVFVPVNFRIKALTVEEWS